VKKSLQRRAQEIRTRAAVRAWDYRQRAYSRGVWFRLRRVLADAEDAYAISREDAAELVVEGYRPEPVGQELEPPKVLVFVSRERLSQCSSPRAVPLVGMGPALLAETHLALVRFPERSPSSDSIPRKRER